MMVPHREVSASIRHLKVFDSVARLRSLGRASEECHVTQPAITQALKKLEEQVGVTLVHRCGTGSYLNEFGTIFHRRTGRFLAQLEQALLELGVSDQPVQLRTVAGRISQPQIRSLLAIVDNGSSAQAARALRVSQATLQRSARDLERALRRTLYAQTASGLVAVPGAVELAHKVKLAQREIELGVDEIDAARGNVGGQIVIGAMNMAGSVMLGSIINDFVLSYTNACIRILNGNAKELHRCLRSGVVDVVIGLLTEPDATDLRQEQLAETPYVIAARQSHPLMRQGGVTLDDLAQFEWVVGNRESSRRLCFDRLFAGRHAPPARIETSSLPTIRLLLSQGDRLALLTCYELMHEEETLASVPFVPIEPVPIMGLTVRKDWLPTQLQASLIDLIRKLIVESLMPVEKLKNASAGRGARTSRPSAPAPQTLPGR